MGENELGSLEAPGIVYPHYCKVKKKKSVGILRYPFMKRWNFFIDDRSMMHLQKDQIFRISFREKMQIYIDV